jgi:Gram-negative bacterial TonB protein C-terminal
MSRIGAIIALIACCTAGALAQATNADTQSQVRSSNQPDRPARVRVSGGVMLGLVKQKTMPVYPDEAMTKGIQGNVIFKIDVDETGKIVLAVPVEGDPLLVAAGVDALRSFRFRPYLLNGAPMRVETQLGYHFSVEKNGGGIKGQVECMSSIPYRPEFRTGLVNDNGVLVLAPRKVSSVEPQLPPELAGKSGSVYLKITIGADGKVQDVTVVGGDEPFIGPVVAAVKQDVYEPQLIEGKPSVSTTEASYHFGPRR